MKTKLIENIIKESQPFLNQSQTMELTRILKSNLGNVEIENTAQSTESLDNMKLLELFISAKQIEGCSDKTVNYYKNTIKKMLLNIDKQIDNILTNDVRKYLSDYKNTHTISKVSIDTFRRIFSSFFSWLEDEGYILKNPVKRIHRIKTPRTVKDTFSDENYEKMCRNCKNIRNLAIIELLISTGIRVGELVNLNISDINFHERECVVFGKGESERIVYFNARCKIHLKEYLKSRSDDNPALFVSLKSPYRRLGINGVERMLKKLGDECEIENVHPHKFRRTLATNAIDKGMPIEQVQKLLGHLQIDTTLQYAMVNQSNVKNSHRKYLG